MVKLTVLGSGTCVPHSKRGSSGYLLSTESGSALFDCGNGTVWKLEKAGVDYLVIDNVFITHFHPDHTSDLIPLLFATKHPYGRKREKTLRIWGPDGFLEFVEKLREPYGNWVRPELVEIHEIEQKKLRTGGLEVKTFKTVHTENSIGYVIRTESKKVVYTGDTGYFPGLQKVASDADIFVTECALPDSEKMAVHMTPSDTAEIIRESNPKKMVLSHLYPSMDGRDLSEEIKSLSGNRETDIIVAEDLMEIVA
ncbi:MAG: ribonuclease Z [Candidatus Dadabacteria bacterium]|nr:ribonuclease Z [Candidatus Dadabacteria bacterium]